MGKVVDFLSGIRTHGLGTWAGLLYPGQYGTHCRESMLGEWIRCHLQKRIQGDFFPSADHCQQPDTTWRCAFPQEMIASVVRVSPNGEHAAKVDGAAERAECPGKQVECSDVSVQGCAEEC